MPQMTRITCYTYKLLLCTYYFGGGDKRLDRMMKVHSALKTFLDLWNVGSGGGQWPSSEVHREIRVVRVKACKGQSIKKCWMDSEGNEHLQAGVVVFLR